jgi:hypothetical protein
MLFRDLVSPLCSLRSVHVFRIIVCRVRLCVADCTTSNDLGRTAATLRSMPGFWRLPDNSLSGTSAGVNGSLAAVARLPVFYACPMGRLACPSSANGSCFPGYEGVMCGVCSPGYHSSGASCTVCEGSNKYMLPVVIVVAALAIALFVFISRRVDTTKLVGAGKVIVSYLQVCVVHDMSCCFSPRVSRFDGNTRLLFMCSTAGHGQQLKHVFNSLAIFFAELFGHVSRVIDGRFSGNSNWQHQS